MSSSNDARKETVAHSIAVPDTKANLSKELFYTLPISHLFGEEYVAFAEDVIRMVSIQLVIQFMLFLQAPSFSVLFSSSFFELLFYVVLGVSVYWLVVKKIVAVK